jgi:hypothetical protein
MTAPTKTHRCVDCKPTVEHFEDELCPSCGRCEEHCQGGNHKPMERVADA